VFPSIAQANKQVSSWKTLVDSMKRADTKGVGVVSRLGGDVPAVLLGGAVGSAVPGLGTGGGAAIGFLIRELVQTPLWQTAGVAARQKAIEYLQKGSIQAAIQVLSTAGASEGVKAGEKAFIKQ
jgi:hypothetical protein